MSLSVAECDAASTLLTLARSAGDEWREVSGGTRPLLQSFFPVVSDTNAFGDKENVSRFSSNGPYSEYLKGQAQADASLKLALKPINTTTNHQASSSVPSTTPSHIPAKLISQKAIARHSNAHIIPTHSSHAKASLLGSSPQPLLSLSRFPVIAKTQMPPRRPFPSQSVWTMAIQSKSSVLTSWKHGSTSFHRSTSLTPRNHTLGRSTETGVSFSLLPTTANQTQVPPSCVLTPASICSQTVPQQSTTTLAWTFGQGRLGTNDSLAPRDANPAPAQDEPRTLSRNVAFNAEETNALTSSSPFDGTSVACTEHRVCETNLDGDEYGAALVLINFSSDTCPPKPHRRKYQPRWTDEEDDLLTKAVQESGASPYDWERISSQHFGGNRTGAQCKHRWINFIDPMLSKDSWTKTEDESLFQAQAKLGNRWKKISKLLPGRSTYAVKRRWYALCRQEKMDQGDSMASA